MTDGGPIKIEKGLRDVPIPIELLTDSELSTTARTVYGILMWHGSTPERCYPGHARIGEYVGIEERSVARPLRALEARGWISRDRRTRDDGSRTSDGYTLYLTRQDTDSAETPRQVPTARSGATQPRDPARTNRANSRGKQLQGERVQGEPSAPPAPPEDAATDGELPGMPPVTAPRPGSTPETREAEAVTREVWESRDPRPVASFVGVRQIVKRLLEAGWSRAEVVAAGAVVPAFTANAFEFQLRQTREPRRAGNGRLQGQAQDDAIRSFVDRHNL